MKKYRIKLSTGRIVGPFGEDQIRELHQKGHISSECFAQVFPGGEWEGIDGFPELAKIINSAKDPSGETQVTSTDLSDNTQVKLAALSSHVFKKLKVEPIVEETKLPEQPKLPSEAPPSPPAGTPQFQEFKFNKNNDVDNLVDYKELEEKYQKEKKAQKLIEDEENEKTRVRKIDHDDDDVGKTVVCANPIPFEPETEPEKPALAIQQEVEEPPSLEEEKTQALSLSQVLPNLKKTAAEAENEIEQLIIESNKPQIVEEVPREEKKPEIQEPPKKKAKTKPIVILAALAILLVLYFPDSKKSLGDLKPVYAPISFPLLETVMDPSRAANELKEGIQSYNKGTYVDRITASNHFKISLQLQFQNNPQALGWLILTYAELLPNAHDQEKSAATLFKLIQLARGKVLTDSNTVVGTAIFYSQIKKYNTAITIIENYLRLKGKPSSKLFAVYLELLLKNARWADARKVYEQLVSVKDPSLDVTFAMAHFLNFDSKREEAQGLLEKAYKNNSESVALALEYSTYLLSSENFKVYEEVLAKVKSAKSEDSPLQIAKYLEHMGMLSIIKKNQEQAAIAFKKALSIHESDELRSKLSALELGGSQKVETLIRESKIIDLINKSKTAESERRWDDAFKLAIDASDFSENYIPAQLWLSYVQAKRGYFESAIQTLEKLQKDNMQNPQVQFALISVYLEARKLYLAQRNLAQLSGTAIGRTSEFAYHMGIFYRRLGNPGLAKKWFSDCQNLNPVNDKAYYELANLYYEGHKLDTAKVMIGKALDLDPENSLYHALTAKIMYEKDGVDTAIGYLRDVSEGKPEDPILIAEIATFYHRSGRLKEFESYLKIVQGMTNPPTSFYEFLISVAKLEDRYDDVVRYSLELLKFAPGNIEVRLSLGESYLKKQDLRNAIAVFEAVKERLPSYPKVNYDIAQAYIVAKDYPKAQKAGEEEIKFNPALEHGYYILGEALRLQSKYPEALLNLEKALTINGKSVETLYALGWIKHRQNYPGIARDFYAKIIKIEPGNADTHKQLGLVYKDLGQSSLAIEYLKTYLDLNPGANDRAEVEAMIQQF